MALTRATDKIIGDSNGNLNLSGIVTATRFSGPLVPSGDLNVGSSIKLGGASGIVTATSFSGSGANLTGVASTENINTSTVANFTGGIQVGGATTLTGALTGTTASFSGDVGIGGTLTYEDVTNIDSVGVITARSGINLTGGVINSAGNINCTSGRFQRGSSTIQDGDAIAGGINIIGDDMDASVIMSVFGNDNDFTRISGSKSRNASLGSHTIVQNNDALLSLKSFGSDGTNFEEAAQIEMQVDGAPNNNVMPGRIVFKTTTTDGVVERLRIKSDGKVNITPGGALSGSHPPGDLNIVGTNFLTMTPNDNANPSDSEVLGHIAFLPYAAGTVAGASAKIEAVAESGQSGSSNATSMRFYTKPSTTGPGSSPREAMRITQDGIVTKPYQPILSMTVNSTTISGNYMSHNSVLTNNGNHYSTSTSKFTCPVAGFYYASIMVMSNNSNTTMDLELHKNQSNASNILVPYQAATGGQYNQVSGSCIIQCAKDDELQFKLNSGSIYNGRHSNITFALIA